MFALTYPQTKCKYIKNIRIFYENKILKLLSVVFSLSSCGGLNGIFGDEFVGQDATFLTAHFKEIPTHDSVDCMGSCTVKYIIDSQNLSAQIF